jgi:uncharacterized surface protein with fasciclin (FAS1) repeats
MKKKFFSLAMVACTSAVFFVACNTAETTETVKKDAPPADQPAVTPKDTMPKVVQKSIVETAIGSADHTTLVAALKAAGLVETLSGAGPFTVFAPTNAGFDKLPKGTVEGLLKADKKADLTKILTYHVVAGAVKAGDLKDGQKIKTLQGKELSVSIKDGKVTINGANVTAADLVCSNGVVHVIDGVLLPK